MFQNQINFPFLINPLSLCYGFPVCSLWCLFIDYNLQNGFQFVMEPVLFTIHHISLYIFNGFSYSLSYILVCTPVKINGFWYIGVYDRFSLLFSVLNHQPCHQNYDIILLFIAVSYHASFTCFKGLIISFSYPNHKSALLHFINT